MPFQFNLQQAPLLQAGWDAGQYPFPILGKNSQGSSPAQQMGGAPKAQPADDGSYQSDLGSINMNQLLGSQAAGGQAPDMSQFFGGGSNAAGAAGAAGDVAAGDVAAGAAAGAPSLASMFAAMFL